MLTTRLDSLPFIIGSKVTQSKQGIEAFEKTKRLIVVAAHPDDLESLCGGTITLLARQGVKIFSVNCTLGDIGAQDPNLARADASRL